MMVSLDKRIEQLKKPLQDKIDEYKAEAPYPFPNEVGLKHPNNNVGVHLRDDNTLEMFAGDARIILDGETGTISIVGAHLVTDTGDTNITTREDNKLAINNSKLNQEWLPKNSGEIKLKSPCVLINPQQDVLAGIAQPGQYPIPLGTLFKSIPLFFEKSDQNFLKDLAALVKE
jgi:hypothetical protein